MTKEELIEITQEALSGGDAPASIRSKYHPSVIEKVLELVFADIIQGIIDKTKDYSVLDNFSKSYYKIAVKKDVDTKDIYADLPVGILPLSPMQAGIRSIYPMFGRQLAFAPIQNSSEPMWNELEAMKIDATCSYMLEGKRVVFYHNTPDVGNILGMNLIPPFSEYDDNDTVFVPGGANSTFFQGVYNIMVQRGNSQQFINEGNSIQTK